MFRKVEEFKMPEDEVESSKRRQQVKAFIWRVLLAAVGFTLFWWLFPLFLNVIKVSPSSALMQLMQAGTAALAIAYVIFGKEPPYPW